MQILYFKKYIIVFTLLLSAIFLFIKYRESSQVEFMIRATFGNNLSNIEIFEKGRLGGFLPISDNVFYFEAQTTGPLIEKILPNTLETIEDGETKEFISHAAGNISHSFNSKFPMDTAEFLLDDVIIPGSVCSTLPCARYWINNYSSGRVFVYIISF